MVSDRKDRRTVLRSILQDYLRSKGPGLLALLNSLAKRGYGVDYVELLLSAPSIASRLVKSIYAGNERVVKTLVVDPLVGVAGSHISSADVERLINEGRDRELLSLLGVKYSESSQVAGKESVPSPTIDDLFELLSCAILIEKMASRVYGKLTKLLPSPLDVAARMISVESSIHSTIYENLFNSLFHEKKPMCRRESRENIIVALEEFEKLLDNSPTIDQLVSGLRMLGIIESSADAEYFMELAVQPILAALDPRLREIYKPLLEAVMHDEQDHQRLVEALIKWLRSEKK